MIPEFTYTVTPTGRVQVVNQRGQVSLLTRAQIENALVSPTLPLDLRRKYTGALAALNKAEREGANG